ncbi:hypothetical protein GCM10009756_10090 [Pseudokineococcus marinus]
MGKPTSSTARGLGYRHQQRRAYLLRVTPDGTPCWWCGRPMYPQTQPGTLDADHGRARAHGGHQADRLLHSPCNRSRGDGSRDHLRPALTGVPVQRSRRPVTSRDW